MRRIAASAASLVGASALLLVGCPDHVWLRGTGGGASSSGASSSGCGTANASAWADWQMPNPPDAGLPNPSSYDSTTADVVIDNVTGLMWQRAVDPGVFYTWALAKSYCGGLTLAGHTDWRLPTRIELVSIVDFTKSNPAIDGSAFPSTPSDWFWTASPVAGSPSFAWTVFFLDGGTYYEDVTKSKRARCVR